MATSVAPRMPMYPPGGPGLGQQIFYGQPPAMIPPQVSCKFILESHRALSLNIPLPESFSMLHSLLDSVSFRLHH